MGCQASKASTSSAHAVGGGGKSSASRSKKSKAASKKVSAASSNSSNSSGSSNKKNAVLYKLLVRVYQESEKKKAAATATSDGTTSGVVTLTAQQERRIRQACTPATVAYQCTTPPTPKSSKVSQALVLVTDPSHPNHLATPLHVAVHLGLVSIVQLLLTTLPEAALQTNARQHSPLHTALARQSVSSQEEDSNSSKEQLSWWTTQGQMVQLLLQAQLTRMPNQTPPTQPALVESLKRYWTSTNVVFYDDNNMNQSMACSPLYRVVQTLPDDFGSGETKKSPSVTVALVQLLSTALVELFPPSKSKNTYDSLLTCTGGDQAQTAGQQQQGDDCVLALLYRRFTRQFDVAEQFFAGDNSSPSIQQHRQRYTTAAKNTWKCLEHFLLAPVVHGESTSRTHSSSAAQRPAPDATLLVHRAVQVPALPPDLFRYIVETNAQDLTVMDSAKGYLPLHYAAACPQDNKFVMDEVLYKFPEAARVPAGVHAQISPNNNPKGDVEGDNNDEEEPGLYPLTLALQAKSSWIAGGCKSLYDAYPQALQQIKNEAGENEEDLAKILQQYPALQQVVRMEQDDYGALDEMMMEKEEKVNDNKASPPQDEHYQAILLVQQDDVPVRDVVSAMWAHEEDAGVQMLACVALSRRLQEESTASGVSPGTVRIAVSATAAVVNAMKAHPNEVIVQEKACHTLQGLAAADGQQEVSMVACGAVSAVVGAMQAHVSDANVQHEAALALARIIHAGGSHRATIVASVSGLTALVNAMAAHPDNVLVQEHVVQALLALTEYPNANLPELPRSQTGDLLEAARTKFPKECDESVSVILSRLS